MTEIKWFGREPAVWIQTVQAALTLLVGFGLPWLSDALAASIVGVLTAAAAAYQAWSVRPVAPTLFSGFVASFAPFLLHFGLNFSQQQVALVQAFVTAVMVLLVRPQSTPAHDPSGAVV